MEDRWGITGSKVLELAKFQINYHVTIPSRRRWRPQKEAERPARSDGGLLLDPPTIVNGRQTEAGYPNLPCAALHRFQLRGTL